MKLNKMSGLEMLVRTDSPQSSCPHLTRSASEVEDVAVEFVVPGGLLAVEEDHVTEVPVLVLLYQGPAGLPPSCQEAGQAGQGQQRLHLPETERSHEQILVRGHGGGGEASNGNFEMNLNFLLMV